MVITALILIAATPAELAAERIAIDARAGRPLVAHVMVALCDNDAQGIAPVSRSLGDGQTPRTNLYWGARYGVRTFLPRDAGWRRVPFDGAPPEGVLERLVFSKIVSGRPTYIVADAWDGAQIEQTTRWFLDSAAGGRRQRVRVGDVELAVGGDAHVIAYVGHNGLMDFAAPAVHPTTEGSVAKSAIVLACASMPYFGDRLRRHGVNNLLLTTNLMAPEAYTLDAALTKWFGGANAKDTRRAAAVAYTKYQRYPLKVGLRLFTGD